MQDVGCGLAGAGGRLDQIPGVWIGVVGLGRIGW